MDVMVPATAVKVAVLDPVTALAEAGTVRVELLLDNEIVVPPEGAAWLSAIVQVENPPETSEDGLQAREVTSMGATRFRVAFWEAPFRVAVTVAVWLVVSVAAVAVKVAVVFPAATTTEAGTVNFELLLVSVVVLPPAGAA